MKLFLSLVFLGLINCSFSSPLMTRKDSSTKPKDGKIENVRIDDILRDYWTARKPRNAELDEEKKDAVPSSVKTDEDTPTPPHTKDATEPPHAKDTPKPTPDKNDPKPTPDSKPTPDETGGKDTPIKTGDKGTPDKAGDKETPGKAGDKLEAPDKTGDKEAPGKAGDKETPDKTGDKEAPGKASDKETPDKTGDKEAPGKAGDKETPDKTGDKETPGKAGDKLEAPDKTGDKETPDKTGDKEAPAKAGDKETPDKTGDKEAPDKTGDKEAPDKIDYVWTSKPYYTKETNIWGRKVWKEGGYRTTDKPYYTESIHNWKDSTYRTKEKDNGYESDYYKMTTKPVYYDRFGGRAWGKATKQKSKKLPQYYWNNHMSYWYDFKTTTAPWRSWDNYESTRGYNYNNYVRWKYDSYEQESSTIPVIILSCLLVVFAFVILFLSRKKLTEIVTGKRNSNTMNSRSLAMNVEEARPLMRQYTI